MRHEQALQPVTDTATDAECRHLVGQWRAVASLKRLERANHAAGTGRRREDQLHQTIGRNIREQRKSRGLTLKQMARRTNLSVSLLSQIERAESSASVSSLFKVATALDLPITELFGDF